MIAQPNPQRDAQDYIDGVLSGDIVVGRLVRLAVERHIDDMKNARARGWKFNRDIATRAVMFFPMCCRHSIGEWDGQAFELAPFQKFIIWSIYGWRNIQTGYRRFRTAYITMARKGGKTTFCSGLTLLAMTSDEPFEAGAQLYCAATKIQQARFLYNETGRMVDASPALRKRLKIAKVPPQISYTDKHSTFEPVSSDKPLDGDNTHLIVIDELHAWREHHRNFFETMSTGGGARRQPLKVMITTAGDDRSELWLEEDDYAVRVVESVVSGKVIDDTMFAFIARLDEEDDPFDEAVWPKANPNYPESPKHEYLQMKANEARHKPTATNQFLRYHCNVKVGSSERAISAEMWKKGDKPLTIKDGSEGFGGFDLGRSDDWCSIGAAFPFYGEPDDEGVRAIEHWEVISKAWCCKDGAFPVTQEPFRTWIRLELLEVHDGDQVDFSVVERMAVEWSDKYAIRNWAYDPNFASVIGQRLQEEHGLEIYKFIQTHRSYNEPVRTFIRELHAGNIWHGNDPILGWQAGNLTVNRNAKDEWMPDKGQKLHKIDGVVSVLMAFAGTITEQASKPSGSMFIY